MLVALIDNIHHTNKIKMANAPQENGWKECHTLGSKAKHFCWKLADNGSINVRRQFKSQTTTSAKIVVEKLLTGLQLDKIHCHVRDNPKRETDLANNVEKLAAGTEKEGLGSLLYEMFGKKDTKDGQLASHLAALFVESGAWTKNNALRGMKFKANAIDWKPCLNAYYHGSSNCNENE